MRHGFDLSSLGLPGFGGELAHGGTDDDDDEDDEDDDEDFDDEDDDDLIYEDRPAGAPHDDPRAFPEEHKD